MSKDKPVTRDRLQAYLYHYRGEVIHFEELVGSLVAFTVDALGRGGDRKEARRLAHKAISFELVKWTDYNRGEVKIVADPLLARVSFGRSDDDFAALRRARRKG